jgi:hypothetical protein
VKLKKVEMRMKRCVHLGQSPASYQQGDLNESIRDMVPGAFTKLHNEFGPGLELLLRRQVPQTELAAVIDKILGNVTLAIESDGLSSLDLLPALVRSTARQLIPTSMAQIETAVNGLHSAVLEGILQQLPDNQREALEMVYVDGTDDQTICAHTQLTIDELIELKGSVRERFRMTAVGQQSRAVSQ